MSVDWLSALVNAYGIYASNKDRGKVEQIPEDPSAKALREKLIGYLDNSPSRDFYGGLLKDRMANGPAAFNLPTGASGYNPYPGGSGAPNYDYSKLIALLGSNAGKTSAPSRTANDAGAVNTPAGESFDRGPRNNVGGTNPNGEGIPAARMPVMGDVSTPGQISSMNPTAASGSMFQTGAQQGMPSNAQGSPMTRADASTFRSFVQQYGKPAGEFVIALLTQNPALGVKAAIDAWRAAHPQTAPATTGGFIPGSFGGPRT